MDSFLLQLLFSSPISVLTKLFSLMSLAMELVTKILELHLWRQQICDYLRLCFYCDSGGKVVSHSWICAAGLKNCVSVIPARIFFFSSYGDYRYIGCYMKYRYSKHGSWAVHRCHEWLFNLVLMVLCNISHMWRILTPSPQLLPLF